MFVLQDQEDWEKTAGFYSGFFIQSKFFNTKQSAWVLLCVLCTAPTPSPSDSKLFEAKAGMLSVFGQHVAYLKLTVFKIQRNPRHLRQAAAVHARMSVGNWQLRSKTSQVDWKLARWQLLQAKRINYLGIMPGEQAWWMQYIIPCHDYVSALGNKEQPVPWDSITATFALSGEVAGFFIRPRRWKRSPF